MLLTGIKLKRTIVLLLAKCMHSFFLLALVMISHFAIGHNYGIQKIADDCLPEAHALLAECGLFMHKTLKLQHWHPFMALAVFQERAKNLQVYGIYDEGKLIGTFNLSQKPRAYYTLDMWQDREAEAVYLGQLAIHPDYQGKKIGVWCMQQIEKIAAELGCTAIRFDCVEQHPWLCKFYEKAGYTKKGIIALPEPTGNVICFEKTIPRN